MQKVGALAHAVELAARCGIHVLRHARTSAHEDGIVSGTEEAVDGHVVLAHHAACDKLHAQSLNLLHLVAHHALRQTILRDAIHQHAAWLSLSLEDGYVETLSSQVASHGQASRSRTDNCHPATSLLRQLFPGEVHLRIEVGDKLLQLAYLHRLSLLAEHTVALALLLVRTHTAADGRQVALGVDDAHRRTHVTHRQLMHEVRDVVLDRTSLLALRNLAVQASLRLLDGLSGGESLVHHLKSVGLLHLYLRLLGSLDYVGIIVVLRSVLLHLYIFLFCLFAHIATLLIFFVIQYLFEMLLSLCYHRTFCSLRLQRYE